MHLFCFLHFAFLLHKNQQSSQFWERLQNCSPSLLHPVSNKQRKHSKCNHSSVSSGVQPWLRLWLVLILWHLPLTGTLVHFLLSQWGWSVMWAEISVSWPKVKEMVLLRCENTDGLGVGSEIKLLSYTRCYMKKERINIRYCVCTDELFFFFCLFVFGQLPKTLGFKLQM